MNIPQTGERLQNGFVFVFRDVLKVKSEVAILRTHMTGGIFGSEFLQKEVRCPSPHNNDDADAV